MYEKRQKKWDKHIDFILLDKLSITIALLWGYVIRHGFDFSAKRIFPDIYIQIWVILLIFDLCVGFLFESYKSIVRRGYLEEIKKVLKHGFITDMLVMISLFISKGLSLYSRVTMSVYFIMHIFLLYILRCIRKHHIRKKMITSPYVEQMLILTDKKHKETCVNKLIHEKYRNYRIVGVVLATQEEIINKYQKQNKNIKEIHDISKEKHDISDAMEEAAATMECSEKNIFGAKVVCTFDELEEYLLNNVVDSIFVDMEMDQHIKNILINYLVASGVTVHMNLINLPHELLDKSVEQIGEFTVLTAGMRVATKRQLMEKRLLDILGGIAGLAITIIAFIIFAPIIYIQSPGPVFFKQDRVGKNGRIFKLYKFRSMYTDAEERKKELMSQNKMEGLMFKMDNDPRIIPIGRFIRKYSIDELPQFLNVVKGDMSLVGTRPPTIDEYEQYQLHHMGRLSSKPGITGLWQVSGRSDMTDFEQIVELDIRYISNWSLGEDIRILWRTVKLVLHGDGAE